MDVRMDKFACKDCAKLKQTLKRDLAIIVERLEMAEEIQTTQCVIELAFLLIFILGILYWVTINFT